NKPYDGNTDATIDTTTAALNGVISGDTVNLGTGSATGAFDTKDIGTGKTVTIAGLTISGADTGNYSLTQPTTTADITQKTVFGHFTASNKTYDGTTDATISGRSLTGNLGLDAVSLTGGTASFDTKDIGTSKTVSGTGFSITGTDS